MVGHGSSCEIVSILCFHCSQCDLNLFSISLLFVSGDAYYVWNDVVKKSACYVANVIDINTKPRPIYSPFSLPSNKPNSSSHFFAVIVYLAMLFILQLMHTVGSVRQLTERTLGQVPGFSNASRNISTHPRSVKRTRSSPLDFYYIIYSWFYRGGLTTPTDTRIPKSTRKHRKYKSKT